jgi:hypothetical protein
MFENLFKKAFNNSEPFRELLEKAIEGADPLTPIFSSSSKGKTPSPPAIKKKNAIKIPSASPAGAKTKTTTQLDSSKIATKQMVTTPQGVQNKTYHEAPVGQVANLVVPKDKKTKAVASNTSQKNAIQQEVTHQPHPSGGTVTVGHPSHTVPVVPEFDHKAKWYHDRLQPGDKVHFNAWSDAYKDWRPISSEVLALNPDGQKILHVKPTHKDLKDDPEAPPMPVHYGRITHFERNDEKEPGLYHKYSYPGQFENPDITAPEGALPDKKIDPIIHHQEMMKREEAIKQKVEGVKKWVQGGDIIEFYTQDPLTKKISVKFGTAYNLQPTKPSGGVKGGQSGKGGKDQQQEINHVAVQTADGWHEVPLDQIKRFGQHHVGKWHFYSFNPDKLEWREDTDAATGAQAGDEEAATVLPTVTPGKANNTEIPEPTTQPKPSNINTPVEPFKDEPHPSVPKLHPQNPTTVISDAGGKVVDEDEDYVYFRHPDAAGVFEIPRDKVTPEVISKMLGKKLVSKDEELAPKKDMTNVIQPAEHWTHKMPEELVAHVRGIVDKIDEYRQKGIALPPSVLAARHQLLSAKNDKGAYRAAAKLDSFMKNPDPLANIKPPTKLDDYNEELGGNAKNIKDVSEAKDILSTVKPADYYLQQKQADVLSHLKDYASFHGLPQIASKLSVDVTKDNRKLLDFYKHYIQHKAEQENEGSNIAPLSANLPSDEHLENSRHLSDLNDYMYEQKLAIPAYQKKMLDLNYLLHENPDHEDVNKKFNDIHSYLYDRGENDPHYQLYLLEQQIEDKYMDKLPPEAAENLKARFQNAEQGITNPAMELDRTIAQFKNNGMPLEPPKVERDFDAAEAEKNQNNKLQPYAGPFLSRTNEYKSRIDNFIKLRQGLEAQKNAENNLAKVEQELEGGEGSPKLPNSNATVTIPNAKGEHERFNLKAVSSVMKDLKNIEKTYLDLATSGNTDHETKQTIKTLEGGLKSVAEKYNNLAQKFSEIGTPIEPYNMPDLEKLQQKPSEESGLPSTSKMMLDFNTKADASAKVWLRNAIESQKNQINVERKHFLNAARKFPPYVQADIANLDKYIGAQMDKQEWEPAPESVVTTPQGKKFLDIFNDYIAKVKRREKMAGVPVEEAYKSLSDLISAEKKIVRRDLSLAIRKSFFNDNDAQEIKHLSSLLASYFDDFIDTVMNRYSNIPLPVRKSIVRTLLKSMISDVVKDNEFSASTMKDDYTAPIDDVVIKSIGAEVANLVTLFKLEAEPDKTFFVIDVNKASNKKPHAIERQLGDLKKFASGLKPIHHATKIAPDEWFEKLKALEYRMHQAKMFKKKISEHRLRKFVTDNDNRTIMKFYNDNLHELNERLSSFED